MEKLSREEIARLGGSVKSEKKKNAARKNGKKGGRDKSNSPSKRAIYMRKYRELKSIKS